MTAKEEFIAIFNEHVHRQGAKELLEWIQKTDFFTAPASTKFHNCFIGGLADHSLNVYYNLKRLVENKHLEDVIPEESIIICGLLHDMSKINYYEKGVRNKKVYSESGSKWDELGRYDWVSEETWNLIPDNKRFIYARLPTHIRIQLSKNRRFFRK